EAIDPRHAVLAEFGRGAVAARLVGGGGDAVEVAAVEAGAGPLHVDRAVAVVVEHGLGQILDEIPHPINDLLRELALGFVPAPAVGALVGDVVPGVEDRVSGRSAAGIVLGELAKA